MRSTLHAILAALAVAVAASASASTEVTVIEGEAFAAGPARIRLGDAVIQLRGVRGPDGGFRCLTYDGVMDCAAAGLEQLEYVIDRNPVRCHLSPETAGREAQCFVVTTSCMHAMCEENLTDLAVEQLTAGMVIRSAGNTDATHEEAEAWARSSQSGVWAEPHGAGLLPPASASEEAFAVDAPGFIHVEQALRRYCGLGQGVTPNEETGVYAMRNAGFELRPGDPESVLDVPDGALYFDSDPTHAACTVRLLGARASRQAVADWIDGLSIPLRPAGERSYEAGAGVQHFVHHGHQGVETLVVRRFPAGIEFTLSRAL